VSNIFKDSKDYVDERRSRQYKPKKIELDPKSRLGRVEKLREQIREICTCPNCGSEWEDPEEIIECWECGTEVCESCMCNEMDVSGDYCEACGEVEQAKEQYREARRILEEHGITELDKV
jgi:hypothetical protein